MSEHQKQLQLMAELAVENGEGHAHLRVYDKALREALIDSIVCQLNKAYQLAACQ